MRDIFESVLLPMIIVYGAISLISGCSNVPVTQPDICYGLQGEAFEDCILRHRGPRNNPQDMGRKG